MTINADLPYWKVNKYTQLYVSLLVKQVQENKLGRNLCHL